MKRIFFLSEPPCISLSSELASRWSLKSGEYLSRYQSLLRDTVASVYEGHESHSIITSNLGLGKKRVGIKSVFGGGGHIIHQQGKVNYVYFDSNTQESYQKLKDLNQQDVVLAVLTMPAESLVISSVLTIAYLSDMQPQNIKHSTLYQLEINDLNEFKLIEVRLTTNPSSIINLEISNGTTAENRV